MESTEPTKNLMRIAEYVDTHELKELRAWFVGNKEEVLDMLALANEQRKKSELTSSNAEPRYCTILLAVGGVA